MQECALYYTLCNLGDIKQKDAMKKIINVLCVAISVPLFSMEMGTVRIFKKPDSQKPKPLIAFHQPKSLFIQRHEASINCGNEGKKVVDELIGFLASYGQIACIKNDDDFADIKSQLQLSQSTLQMESEHINALLYAALATSGATYQVLNSNAVPRVSVSLAGGHSFAGPATQHKDYMLPDIPLAIKKFAQSYSLKKILIIDENSEKNMRSRVNYYLHGNGAIFYNDDIASIYNDINIIVANQISCLLCEDETSNVVSQELLEKYLVADENIQQQFDLAYYVVRLKNLKKEMAEGNNAERLCNDRIYSLLNKHIPTVVVFSGDVEKYPSIAVRYMRNVFGYAQQVYNRYKQ